MYNIAIIGASGLIGRSIIDILYDRNFPIKNLYLLGKEKKQITVNDEVMEIKKLEEFDFTSVDIIFNATEKNVIMKYIGAIMESGAFLIDKSDALRLDKDIPLVVADVNFDENNNSKIISSPNCVAIPTSTILSILSSKIEISQIFMTTFQSVSGAGSKGTDALLTETKKSFMSSNIDPMFFDKTIAFDVIPQIGNLNFDLSSTEELKVKQEIKKILNKQINIHVTCTRVPVLKGHAINIQIPCKSDRESIIKILQKSELVHVCDREDSYITQKESSGEDLIFISRIRHIDGVLSMWISYDNVRVGGSLNGVKIAEKIINKPKNQT